MTALVPGTRRLADTPASSARRIIGLTKPPGEILEQRGGRGRVPVGRGRTRPRYLITSARVQALFPAALAPPPSAPRAPAPPRSGTRRPRRARARPRGRLQHATPTARPRPGSRRACARACPPAGVRLRDIQRAVLRVARLEIGRLREVREFALRRRAAVLLLELRGAGCDARRQSKRMRYAVDPIYSRLGPVLVPPARRLGSSSWRSWPRSGSLPPAVKPSPAPRRTASSRDRARGQPSSAVPRPLWTGKRWLTALAALSSRSRPTPGHRPARRTTSGHR